MWQGVESGRDVTLLMDKIRHTYWNLLEREYPDIVSPMADQKSRWAFFQEMRRIRNVQDHNSSAWKPLYGLAYWLDEAGETHCEDPRDKLFGILKLVRNWNGAPPIIPEHALSRAEVFLEFQKSLILQNFCRLESLDKVAHVLSSSIERSGITALGVVLQCCLSYLLGIQVEQRADAIKECEEHDPAECPSQHNLVERALKQSSIPSLLHHTKEPLIKHALLSNGAFSYPLNATFLRGYSSRKDSKFRYPIDVLDPTILQGPLSRNDPGRDPGFLEVIQIDKCPKQLVVDRYESAVGIIEIDLSSEK